MEKLFTATYHPKANEQVEIVNRIPVSGLRRNVGEHPKDSYLFIDAIMFTYNTKVHKTKSIVPFELET